MASTIEINAPAPADYSAASDGAGMIDRSERGKLALSGPDAIPFLDSLLSQDIAAIALGAGADATLLEHKGHMLAEVRVLRTEEELLLDCERVALQALFDALTQYSLGWEARLHKRTLERGLLSVVGLRSAELAGQPALEVEHAHAVRDVGGVSVRLIRTRLGIDVLCDSSDVERVRAGLAELGVVPIGVAAYECVRIEAGIPRFGVEIDEGTMPQEAGLHERAVSFTKGCYVGQETVARLYWKGKPNRLLRGLRLSAPVSAGAELFLGERDVGRLASAAISPRFGAIGMALVRREAEPGAQLSVADGAASATVTELPFST